MKEFQSILILDLRSLLWNCRAWLDKGERFDMIYIDGSHEFDEVFVDAYYSYRLLSPGGIMLLDDSPHPPSQRSLTCFAKIAPD